MPVHRPLAEHTGESLGVQYLFDQTGMAMTILPDPDQLDDYIDEGFKDTDISQVTAQFNEEISTFSVSVDEEESDVDEVSTHTCVLYNYLMGQITDTRAYMYMYRALKSKSQESLWTIKDILDRTRLMPWLMLSRLSIKASQVESIKKLYQNLMEFDKHPLQFS